MSKQELIALIASNRTEDVLQILLNTTKSDVHILNQVATLSATFHDLEAQKRTGQLSVQEENLTRARITNGLLSIVKDLPHDMSIRTETLDTPRLPPQTSSPTRQPPYLWYILGSLGTMLVGASLWYYVSKPPVLDTKPSATAPIVAKPPSTTTPIVVEKPSATVDKATVKPPTVVPPKPIVPKVESPPSSSFIGTWHNIDATANTTKSLRIRQKDGETIVAIMGVHGDMNDHFTKVVSAHKLSVDDFSINQNSTWYRNMFIELQSNTTLVITYEAHLSGNRVYPVHDTMQKE